MPPAPPFWFPENSTRDSREDPYRRFPSIRRLLAYRPEFRGSTFIFPPYAQSKSLGIFPIEAISTHPRRRFLSVNRHRNLGEAINHNLCIAGFCLPGHCRHSGRNSDILFTVCEVRYDASADRGSRVLFPKLLAIRSVERKQITVEVASQN